MITVLRQVLQLQSTLETVSLQLDNESKEKAVLQETVESLRMEMAFLQEQNEALELTLQNEREAHKDMAHRLQVRYFRRITSKDISFLCCRNKDFKTLNTVHCMKYSWVR